MSEDSNSFDWEKAIQRLEPRIHRESLEPSVVKKIQSETDNHRLLVACSGGADSVYMLLALKVLAQELGIQLGVAHYNHRWRGSSSEQDAAFVRQVSAAIEVPYFEASRPENETAFTETTARALRLDFLRSSAKEFDCKYICFGHQLDDILETQLQRIARGSGSEGLAAPRPISTFPGFPTHLRPILQHRSVDIRMALNSAEIPWREDKTNADTRIPRNAMRAEVIPALTQALDRDPATGAARSRRLLEEDAEALSLLAMEAVPDAFYGESILKRCQLQDLPTALLRRALTAWLSKHGLNNHFGASAMDTLVQVIKSDQPSHLLSAGPSFIRIREESITIESLSTDSNFTVVQDSSITLGESKFLPRGMIIETQVVAVTAELRIRLQEGQIDEQREAYTQMPQPLPLQVRGWRPGDRYRALGAPGSKKLKDWFIDRRIPRAERKYLPVVTTAEGEIIWVPGLPPAEFLKICEETNRALRLTYRTVDPLSSL